ncbi:putative Methyl-accepting chemotaxis protein [Magnetospirillum sp. XM-1]|uniref:methyl-accepting chemotaxis protein n=1 Tax=Magnetospirillum sp. XM-1 TaxID=1663591 RepID=UPI00073DF4A9|nr:nitrate- and nitrite sensing domain-containing protein [Magnetospirillum sp. XM-1]CUW40519.1 putative Methyl-accepting chemotaxis protein [Magnetospirillum sp. XM-1]
MTLRNSRIGGRIAFGILPVIAALIVLSFWLVRQDMAAAGRGKVLTGLADVAVKANGVVHELQRERGSSALFLGSKGTQFAAELADRRKASDGKIAELEAGLGGLEAATAEALGSGTVEGMRDALRRLPDLRGRVDRLEPKVPEAVGAYTEAIRRLIAAVARVGIVSPDVETAKLISSYVALTDAKESAGLERATGAGGFASGKFEPVLYRRYLELGAEQRSSFAVFLRYASAEAVAALKAALSPEIEEPVTRMRTVAVESAVTGTIGDVTGPAWFAASTKRIDALKTVEDHIGREIHAQAGRLRDEATRSLVLMSTGLALLLALTGVIIVAVVRSIVRPVSQLADAMTRLSGGDLNVRLDGTEYADEIAEMARATQVFREHSEARQRLEAERAEAEHQAAINRRQMLHDLADHFEATVKAKVAEVGRSTAGIRGTAQIMAKRSETSGGRSLDVAEASKQTTERADVVSEATRQMTISVNEIAQQVGHASHIARRAVDDVSETTRQMNDLSQAVQSIGEIVKMISDIAAQTNLLALNATIEAARAGEAGKGFAVVANEVKNLANQTARATDDITTQVAAIQDSTRDMTGSIAGVVETIRSIDQVSSAIAGAVQEQEATTRDISGNIGQVAVEAAAVSGSVAEMSRSSAMACAGTVRVIWSARALADVVSSLETEVEQFLRTVRD